MLPHRFQKAIDRAAMVAGKKTAQDYVGEWRRTSYPLDGELVATVDADRRVDRARVHQRAPARARRQRRLGSRVARRAEPVTMPRTIDTSDTSDPRTVMTHTVISSATKEVVIGFDRPFVMIGERINPTGRKLLAEEMKNGDFSRVEADALAQVAAGAHMLDVNAGIPLADEPALLARAIQLVQSVTDVPLSIDSSIVEALEAGLAVYQGKALVNSVTGEDEQMERVLPLVAKYGAAVVAISNDETGISEDPDVRFEVAQKIVNRASDYGIPASDIVVDPLVMPIGAMGTAGQQVFALLRRLVSELKVNTTCGASRTSASACPTATRSPARSWRWRSATA
jgi:5-methyltetrahydrofolate--homocysteine methyltransferase